jgi:alpha-N-arabinofuranosidase
MLPLCLSAVLALAAGRQAAFAQSTTSSAPDVLASNYIIASNPNVTSVNLTVTTRDYSKQNETAPKLYGLMFEDIDHSGDGGIYAEMLINRAFQGVSAISGIRLRRC